MDAETTTILVDTALASGSASALDPEERRLQELVLAVRDDAPAPDPDFALRMDARVAAGFPSRRRRIRIPQLVVARPRMTALGVAASVLIALVVAVGLGSHPGTQSSAPDVAHSPSESTGAASSSTAAGSAAPARPAQTQAAPAAKGAPGITSSDSVAVPSPVPPPVQPGGFVGGSNRKVERSASLYLAPDPDKLNDVGDQVIAVTDRYHGIVMDSSITSSGDGSASGNYDLKIPVRNLQPALRDLSALADVTSRTENSDDVTASFVNARTRLQELNAERRGLLRRLEKAPTDQAAAAIRARLRIVNAEIQAQMNQLTDLRRRTSYASVNVRLEPKQKRSGGGGIGSGARDLRDSLVAAANLSLRVLGVALPLAILGALFWAAAGWVTRRRREAVLGPPSTS